MKHSITDIPGIGESTATLLADHGIDSVKTLRKGGMKKLCRVPGFGEMRAASVLAAADTLKDGDKLAARAAKQAEKDAAKADKALKTAAKKAAKETEKAANAAKKAALKANKEATKAAGKGKSSKKASGSNKKKGKKK